MMRKRNTCILLTLLAGSLAVPAQAQPNGPGAWLDRPLTQWNTPGMQVSRANSNLAANREFCASTIRQPQTSEDQLLADRGWFLTSAYQGGWGIVVIQAQGGWDGMCRPWDYQGFVFVDGVFAGTIAPEPMGPRSDGSASFTYLREGTLSVEFVRYADSDPLCCPSLPSANVIYHVDRTASGPVLIAENVFRVGS